MMSKKVLIMDVVIVIGSLMIIAGMVGYSRPLVIAPLDGFSTTSTSVLFEFEKAERILIDDNSDFTSPEEVHVRDNLVINLKPGIYYWKVSGALDSEIRKLTIQSEIDLQLRETEDNFEIVNAGNERLNVDVYENGKLSGNVKLDVSQSKKVFGNKFIGRQDEN